MLRSRRMPPRLMAELCGRLSIALGAGIDLRRAWASEMDRVPRRWRPTLEVVARGLAAGNGLAASLRAAGGVFPPLVCSIVEVGDRTGHEPEILRELATSSPGP